MSWNTKQLPILQNQTINSEVNRNEEYFLKK